jgi:hypothetical protein
MRPVYLKVHVHPSSATGKCRVYINKDWSATAETLTRMTGDVFPDGTTVGDGTVTSADYMEVDLDGGDGDVDGFWKCAEGLGEILENE